MSRTATTITSREFIQDTGRAKREAAKGPVFITTRGNVSHVLMTKEEFDRRIPLEPQVTDAGTTPRNLAEALADNSPEGDFDFEIPEFKTVFKGFQVD